MLFYVYEHWRPDRDECFYVGKGKGRRANQLGHSRNRFHHFIQDKLARLGMCVEVRMVAEGLFEDEAFALEIERIAFWRADGVDLANLTDGGDGQHGRTWTQKQREAHARHHKGKSRSAESRERIRLAKVGTSHSTETRAKISASKKGQGVGLKRSPEACAKMSAAQVGNTKWLGRKHSPETIAKMTASQRARFAKEKSSE